MHILQQCCKAQTQSDKDNLHTNVKQHIMFADKILEKLYDGSEEINTIEKADNLLIMMWGNNVTITDDFVYYCEELMNASIHNHLVNTISNGKAKIRCGNMEQVTVFFSMLIGLGFYLPKEITSQVKLALTPQQYHLFHHGMHIFYNLSPLEKREIQSYKPKRRRQWFTEELNKRLEKERVKNQIEKERREEALKEKIKKEQRENRLKHIKRIRDLNAKRAKHINLDASGHSVWSTKIILTNMGGKR